MKRSSIFILSLVVLVGLFLLATLVYRGGKDGQAAEQAVLVRMHAQTLGPPEAKVHIVEFLDPACEACRAFYPFVKQLMAANPGKIKLTTRHVDFHRGADQVVKVLEASKKQGKYWPTLEAVLASQPQWAINHEARVDLLWQHLAGVGLDLERLRSDMNAADTERNMKQDRADANALKVEKTPEYFVNGRRMATFGYEQLRKLVQDELAASYR
ncbi:MAG TPA: thioredoxin domain-containing protein [Burkholderiaceae bacterium]|nr:thioredoxin domain-containing protein [Burkholderiaceae bacterium]